MFTTWTAVAKEIREYFDVNPETFLKGDAARRSYNGTSPRLWRELHEDPYLDLVRDEHYFGTHAAHDGHTQATLRSVFYIRQMEKYFDPWKVDYLLDFGPGYGNNARVWDTLFSTPKIVLCDLEILHPVSKYYLDTHGITAEWIHMGEIEEPPNAKNSLFFATHSLNECTLPERETVVPWLGAFEHVYIVYNQFFNGMDNRQYFEHLAQGLPHERVEILFSKVNAKWTLIATGL